MTFTEDYAAGAGIAALELHKALITLRGTLPKAATIALIDQSMLSLENMNAAVEASSTLQMRQMPGAYVGFVPGAYLKHAIL